MFGRFIMELLRRKPQPTPNMKPLEKSERIAEDMKRRKELLEREVNSTLLRLLK